MKKSLIAVAAVLATSAYAQSTVEAYGRLDLGFNSTKITLTDDPSVQKTTSAFGAEGGSTTSRLGFRGTEDLGGGLKASFVIETAVSADAETRTFGNTRLANLALAGGFGTATIGTFNTAFDDILTGAGVSSDFITADFVGQFNTTASNALSYSSPKFGGFAFGAAIMRDKTTLNGAATTNSRGQVLSVSYESGPLTVMAAHSSGKVLEAEFDDAFTFNDVKASGTAVQVKYDMSVVVPYIILGNGEVKSASGELDGNAFGAMKYKSSGLEIGASFPMGAFTPYVAYGRVTDKVAFDGVLDWKAKTTGYHLGTTYALSKRTNLYAAVGSKKTKFDGVVQFKLSETKIGLVHSF